MDVCGCLVPVRKRRAEHSLLGRLPSWGGEKRGWHWTSTQQDSPRGSGVSVVLLAVLKGGYDIYLFVFHYCLSKYMSQALSLCPCEIFLFAFLISQWAPAFYQICLLQLCFRFHCQGVIGLTRNHVKAVVSCELGGTENNPGGTPLCVPISREDGGKAGSSATKWIQSSRLSDRKRSEKSGDTSPWVCRLLSVVSAFVSARIEFSVFQCRLRCSKPSRQPPGFGNEAAASAFIDRWATRVSASQMCMYNYYWTWTTYTHYESHI